MAPKVRAQRQSLAERVQKAGKAKAAQGASGASTARKRKAAEAGASPLEDRSDPGLELSDDPLDAEGQNALLLLLTSLAKSVASLLAPRLRLDRRDCLSQSGLTGDARSAAKAQLNELLAVCVRCARSSLTGTVSASVSASCACRAASLPCRRTMARTCVAERSRPR